MFRKLFLVALAVASLAVSPLTAKAVLTPQDGKKAIDRAPSARETLEIKQYRLPETRIAGQESIRQNVTIWEVTSGNWNGENLAGLNLVLVQSASDNTQSQPLTSCYISCVATLKQRAALLSAFLAATSVAPDNTTTWTIEPAVINLEIDGKKVVVHLGLVA